MFLTWDEDDQDKALQWTMHQNHKCQNCGTSPDEWVDSDGRWVYPSPYVVEVTACTGCQELEEEKKRAEGEGQDLTGVYMSLVANYE